MVLQNNSDKVSTSDFAVTDIGLLFIGYYSTVTVRVNMYAHMSSNKEDCYPGLHTLITAVVLFNINYIQTSFLVR